MNLWVETSKPPSNTIFDDFPQDVSALKPLTPKKEPTARASFASFAKVKKEQAKYAKRDVVVPTTTTGSTRRRSKKTAAIFTPPAPRATARGRRKAASDDVDSKLRDMEEQLKNLDPNSKEAKKQRRLIRNRMSAQLHRERKKMYVDQLEGELYHRDLEISRLRGELATLRDDNTRLKRELQNQQEQKDDLLSPDVLQDCLFSDLELPAPPSSPELMTDVEGDYGDMTPRSSESSNKNNVTVLLAVAFSVAFFGNTTQLLDELINGQQDLESYLMKLELDNLPAIALRHEKLKTLKNSLWESDFSDQVEQPTKRARTSRGNDVQVAYGSTSTRPIETTTQEQVEEYNPEVLKTNADVLVEAMKQSGNEYHQAVATLKSLHGNISYLKFLFPNPDGTFQQIRCDAI